MQVWVFTKFFLHLTVAIYCSQVHSINTFFDCDSAVDVRGVFLDTSKTFNKVWHDEILFKLETYGVKRNTVVPM